MPKADSYSVYDAKARFSELIRKVRNGQRIRITFRGAEVAEIGPIPAEEKALEEYLQQLEMDGRLTRVPHTHSSWTPLKPTPGALKRFIEERE